MANITKRGNSYRIQVELGKDIHGKRIVESMTYHPKATTQKAIEREVGKVALEFEDKVRKGIFVEGDKTTFAEFAEVWKSDWARRNLTKRAYEDYIYQLEKTALPAIGHMKLSQIKPMHIQGIINQLEAEGKAPKTIRHKFGSINSVMRYAYRMELIERNPCERCELPKMKPDTELHFFTIEQAKTFLNALTEEYTIHYPERERVDKNGKKYKIKAYSIQRTIPLQFQVYFTLALLGGFRKSELLALTWNDVDQAAHTITVSKAASRFDGKQFIKEPKTPAANRTISLPDSCFDLLAEWKLEQTKQMFDLGSKWEGKRGKEYDDNFIFITTYGKMMDLNTPGHKFKEILDYYNGACEREENKLPYIRLHDLRHTSATLLLAMGTDIETVKNRMGHSRASITLDVYGHALPSVDLEASEKLSSVFEEDIGKKTG